MAGLPTTIVAVSPTQQSGTVSTPVSSPPAVRVTDLDGFPVEGVTVAFTVTAGNGTRQPSQVVTDAFGTAQLTSWTLGGLTGTNTLEASVVGLAPVEFNATGVSVVATSIAPTTATSQQAVVGTNVPESPQVRVTGAGGVPVAGVTVSWQITAGGGSFGFLQVITDAAGVSQPAHWKLGTTPGLNEARATVAGLSGSPVVFQATGLSAGATTIAPNSTTSLTAQVNSAVSPSPSVVVTDALGLPVAGVTVDFVVTAGGGSGGGTAVTNGSGVASAGWTLGGSPGTNNNTLEARVTGLSGSPVVFTATATAGAPGSGTTPTQIAANSSTSQSAQVGTKVAASPSVIVRDASSVAVAGVTVTFTVIAGGGQISHTSLVTNGSGIATLDFWNVGPVPGANTLQASVAGLTGSPVTFTATATAGTGQLAPAAYRDALYVPAVHKLYLSGGAQTVGGTGNIVRVFDAKTRKHLHDVVVGNDARGLVLAAGKVYVGLGAGNIAVIDTETDTVATTITIAGSWYRGVYVPTIDRVVFVQSVTGAVIQINPSTDTQSTLIASVGGIGHIVYASSNDRLYIPNSSNSVSVFNPSSGALVTTIGGSFQNNEGMTAVYASTSPDGVYCSALNSGSTRRLAVITPSSNTVRGHVDLGTTGTPQGGLFVAATGRVYLPLLLTGTPVRTSMLTINPVTDAVERTDGAAPGAQRLSGYMTPHGTFWQLSGTSGQSAVPWNTASRSTAVRSAITASGLNAPHVTLAEAQPFGPGDLVLVRRDAEGSYRVRLEWPAQIAAQGLRREMWHEDDTVRGERNWVLNPWARDWASAYHAPGWILASNRESRWHSRDTSPWTSVIATLDGAHSGATVINFRGLTPGDVLEPGDYLQTFGRFVAARGVVAADGKVSVPIYPVSGVSAGDGASITVRRPPVPDWLVTGQGVVGYGSATDQVDVSVQFPVPFYAGLTTLWCTVECWLWVAAGTVIPSSFLGFRRLLGQAQAGNIVNPTDTGLYNDPSVLLGPFTLSSQHVLAAGDVLTLNARLTLPGDGTAAAIYVRRFQATLGPEPDIEPPFEINASRGALFHAAQRALRDRAQAPVQYTCTAQEAQIDKPLELGVRVDLRHQARGIVATPRLLSITRTITPESEEDEVPTIHLDNLPPSLARRLSSSGVS